MKIKFAVALMKGDEERILAVFDTKEEADAYGTANRLPHCDGLEYCFSAPFRGDRPCGFTQNIYSYYNA